MNGLLLTMSYLIHFILLVAIFLLFQQIRSLKNNEADDVYKVLEVYLEEIKLENEKLKQMINTQNTPDSSRKAKEFNDVLLESIENEHNDNNSNDTVSSAEYSIEKLERLNRNKQEEVIEEETSILSRALYMQNEGLTVSEIAKKLNRGKTEIELLLKLRT